MGMRPAPEKCFITGLPTKDRPTQYDTFDYSISIGNETIYLQFDLSYEPTALINENKHILIGLLLNKKIDTKSTISVDYLTDIIKTSDYPRNPSEKMLEVLRYINSISAHEGDEITLYQADLETNLIPNRLYLRNYSEFTFYLYSLLRKGLIDFDHHENKHDALFMNLHLSVDGLNKLIDSENISKDSKRCFIAMSFHDDEKPIKEAIKQACVNTGYNPILINEININSDTTVNDAIIAELRKAKFCIADFTRQRNGVYFESGFALGLGLKVIYSCHEEWFKESHFDTNHFSHIIYDDPSDLTKSLEDKIRAWIN